MEALITLNLSNYSENIIDILEIFRQIGWDVFNAQGNIEYLPIDDDDEYNWLCEGMPINRLYDIISRKMAKKEQIGVTLFYNNGAEGIALLANTTEQIILSISINRKIFNGKNTDMVWYLKNIIYKLFDNDIRPRYYILEEYED